MEQNRQKRKSREVYVFKKGQHLHLDSIYTIQGLCKGDWWIHAPDEHNRSTESYLSDNVIITRDITIEIIEK